jgi:hypothetical protein
MSQEEKKRYDRLAHSDMEKYEDDFINYKKRLQLEMPESQVVSNCSESFSELDEGMVNTQMSCRSVKSSRSVKSIKSVRSNAVI